MVLTPSVFSSEKLRFKLHCGFSTYLIGQLGRIFASDWLMVASVEVRVIKTKVKKHLP